MNLKYSVDEYLSKELIAEMIGKRAESIVRVDFNPSITAVLFETTTTPYGLPYGYLIEKIDAYLDNKYSKANESN